MIVNPYIAHKSSIVWVPATLGPTTTPSAVSTTNMTKRFWKYTAAVDIKIVGVSFYHNTAAGNIKIGLYSDSAGDPGALLETRELAAATSGLEWKQYDFTTETFIAAGTVFWVGRRTELATTTYYDWDTHVDSQYKKSDGAYEYTMPDPAPAVLGLVTNEKWGIFLNIKIAA